MEENNFQNSMKTNEIFLNSLYTIKRMLREGDSNKLSAMIRLNPSHEIFKGHFPGNPILPGVCVVQILKEILMYQSDNKLILNYASSIKYLSYINPVVNSIINIDVELKEAGDGNIFCIAILYFESVVFCRFKGEFKIIRR
jgi:3-hydroxyacyl-[acyl-carrier-protein] dehydratase